VIALNNTLQVTFDPLPVVRDTHTPSAEWELPSAAQEITPSPVSRLRLQTALVNRRTTLWSASVLAGIASKVAA